jgi:hypothetical protein
LRNAARDALNSGESFFELKLASPLAVHTDRVFGLRKNQYPV